MTAKAICGMCGAPAGLSKYSKDSTGYCSRACYQRAWAWGKAETLPWHATEILRLRSVCDQAGVDWRPKVER